MNGAVVQNQYSFANNLYASLIQFEQERVRGPGRYEVNTSTLVNPKGDHGWHRTFDPSVNAGLPTLRQKLRSENQDEVGQLWIVY